MSQADSQNMTANMTATEYVVNWERLVNNCLLLTSGAAATIGSGLIAVIILRYPSLKQKTDAIHMMMYLAFCDGFTGVGSAIAAIHRMVVEIPGVTFNRGQCLASSCPLIFGFMCSQMMIGWVALDRYTAVSKPLEYKGKNHVMRAKRRFLITLVIAVLVSVPMFEGDFSPKPATCSGGASFTFRYRMIFASATTSISLLVIVVYLMVIVVLKRQLNKVGPGHSAFGDALRRQAKVTKVIMIILALYAILWVVPASALNLGGFLGWPKTLLGILGPTLATGAGMSAASNILIYTMKMPDFRAAFRKYVRGEKDNGNLHGNHTSGMHTSGMHTSGKRGGISLVSGVHSAPQPPVEIVVGGV